MAASNRAVVAVFTFTGLLAGMLIVPLAFVWLPIVFGCEGTLFALGFSVAYVLCRRSLPRPEVFQFCLALLVFVLAFPLAIAFGGAMALASEFSLMGVAASRPWLSDNSPLVIMACMLLWGSLAAALFVNIALALLTAEWNNRVFRLLLVMCVSTAAVSFAAYVPAYFSVNPLIVRYRELALFAVLSPLGNAVIGAVCAAGLLSAAPAPRLDASAGPAAAGQ
jgi:hypothetical protein